jgi:hypothetical protein
VSGAVMLGCIIFLHPVYGLAVGGMLGVINFQILGWIAGKMYNPFHMLGWGEAVVSMNYNLIYNPFTMTWMEPVAYIDLIAFGVMVMAIGFEIEYVVHIAHAFLHCEGTGLLARATRWRRWASRSSRPPPPPPCSSWCCSSSRRRWPSPSTPR